MILMMVIVIGIFICELNWIMLGVGVVLGIVFIVIDWLLVCCGGVVCLLVLVVGIGIYLLLMVSSVLFLGVVLGWLIECVLCCCVLVVGVDLEVYVDKLC